MFGYTVLLQKVDYHKLIIPNHKGNAPLPPAARSVQDSVQRMDNLLLSPVLLEVLHPDGRNCNIAPLGCRGTNDGSDFMR